MKRLNEWMMWVESQNPEAVTVVAGLIGFLIGFGLAYLLSDPDATTKVGVGYQYQIKIDSRPYEEKKP